LQVEVTAAVPAAPLHPLHQALINEVLSLHEQGMTNRDISDHLNASGMLSWRGKEFYPQLVFGIIRKAQRRQETAGGGAQAISNEF
jgi:hypothetical protein